MTNSQPHSKPTSKQLKYLRYLAMRSGQSFTYPRTFSHADAEIKRLKGSGRMSPADRRREAHELSHQMAERGGDAAAVRSSELTGYGSSATWSQRA
jgi:hypothetical protein